MIESENHNNLQASAQKLERELRRSLNTFQGYIHALEEEELNKKQATFLHKLQNESDRMNRKLNAFGKVLDTELNLVGDNSSVFNTKETFESIIAMLKVDFPEVTFKLVVDPKIEGTNHGKSGIITDMIHGVAVLLLQHRSSKLTIKLHLSQITAGNQFVDIILEADDCSLNDQDLLSYLRFDEADVSDKNRFVSSLSFELSRKLIRLKSIEPQVEVPSLNKVNVTIYDQWQAYSEVDLSSVGHHIESSIENLHLLIVEDDKLNQLVTSMMIKNFGWTCDIANDGIEALEMFSPNLHQCILMDIEMPRMDGYACTAELRKRFGNDIPIIALSAYNENKDSVIYESKGLDNYLLKPVKKDVLYSKIKQAMLAINR